MKVFKPANDYFASTWQLLLLGLVLSMSVISVRAQDNIEKFRDGLLVKFGQVQVESGGGHTGCSLFERGAR